MKAVGAKIIPSGRARGHGTENTTVLQVKRHHVSLYLKEEMYGESGLLLKTWNALGQYAETKNG
jgi:hypothetical protein